MLHELWPILFASFLQPVASRLQMTSVLFIAILTSLQLIYQESFAFSTLLDSPDYYLRFKLTRFIVHSEFLRLPAQVQ